MNVKTAKQLADYYAQDAHDNFFSSHRGIWHLEDEDLLLLYSNHPYSVDSLRPNEVERIEQSLESIGIKTLAHGAGGPIISGNQRYTVTLLLDCGNERKREVLEVAQAETEKSYAELDRVLRNGS